MDVYNKDYLEKIANDDYFSSIVKLFDNEKTIDNFIDVCKVLEYRTFYIAYETTIIDHHLRACFKHNGNLPIESFEDESKMKSILLSFELKVGAYKEEVICVFTDPSKIDFKQVKVNTIRVITLRELWDKYFSDERFGGICINCFNEQIMIPYDYIKFILDNKYDEIEKRMKNR